MAGAALAGSCPIASCHNSMTGQLVGVDCFSGSGIPQNRNFTIA